jgi:hypothetical protein
MSRHRASSMLNIYGLNYCADHTNGNIYEYSLDEYTDNGDPIIKQRDTAVIHGGLFGVPGKKLFFDEVEFIIVAGQTQVEGTGLGPQPPAPADPPLTDCSTVWDIGSLIPDLHVGGEVAGVWNKDLIVGTGVLDDDRIDNAYSHNDDGEFLSIPGGEVVDIYYPDCQWYNYSGPQIYNKMAGTTTGLTDSSWTKAGGI